MSSIPSGTRFPSVFSDFRREMDRLMERFDEFFESDGGEMSRGFSPQANIAETEKEYEITIDLPGMKAEDFNIEMRHGDL